MIKKVNKKYTLTSINDKKRSIKIIHWPVLVLKKYTLICISIKKIYTLASINDKKRSIKSIH